MVIEEIIKGIAKMAAKILLNKEEKSSVKIELDQISSTDIIPILLKRLVYEGEYNKAENILFDELNKNNSYEMYLIAVDFYNLLLEKSDEELAKGKFSREEIYQGLEDIKKFIA